MYENDVIGMANASVFDQQYTVLLVDEDLATLQCVEKLLKEAGYGGNFILHCLLCYVYSSARLTTAVPVLQWSRRAMWHPPGKRSMRPPRNGRSTSS